MRTEACSVWSPFSFGPAQVHLKREHCPASLLNPIMQASAIVTAIGGPASKFSVAEFSSGVIPVVPLTPKPSVTAETIIHILTHTPSQGSTGMDVAIASCHTQLTSIALADTNTRAIILITDGQPDSVGMALNAATAAKAAGLKLVTVGVGQADTDFLRGAASAPEYAFSAKFDYEATSLATGIAKVMCPATGGAHGQPCGVQQV